MFVPITVDRKAANTYSGGCTVLCYPRTMTLTVAYYQLDTSTKRIIEAQLKFDDFDKDSSVAGYTLNVVYYPLDYWDLIIKFAFERTVFIALFVVIGCMSVLVAALYWLNVRITTQVSFNYSCPAVAAIALIGMCTANFNWSLIQQAMAIYRVSPMLFTSDHNHAELCVLMGLSWSDCMLGRRVQQASELAAAK